jgi:hypothetical protein
MDWSSDSLYAKAKVYAQRAHNESIESALFGFWTSLSVELLARAALAKVHPALLADPSEPDNIQYAFGIVPAKLPKSIRAKAVFARCMVFVTDFTKDMSAHCLILADRRNAELHSGAAAFEGIDNAGWLSGTYEIMEVLLKHIGGDFQDFLGEDHEGSATAMLKDRRATIKKEVQEKLSTARKFFASAAPEWLTERLAQAGPAIENWLKNNNLRRPCTCPACGSKAVMSGESIGRSPVRIDAGTNTIKREVRVLPNTLICVVCKLKLSGFHEMNEAGMGSVYTVQEEEDPIEFFGINPEEYVDVEELIRNYDDGGYMNE